MKILIKTPLYKQSKYIPHLVEHSIFNNTDKNFKTYIKLQYPVSAVTETGYTEFNIPETIDAKTFLKQHILQDLIYETTKKEKKIIKDENTNISYRQDLLIKIGQHLYNKSFSLTRGYQTNFKEILQYQKKYYKNGNIIICDDNYNKIHREQSNTTKTKTNINKEINLQISLNYEKYNIYSKGFGSWKDFYIMKFIEILISSYLARNNTTNLQNYFYEDEGFFIIDEYIALSFPHKTKLNITQDMIKQTKAYFNKSIKNHKFLFGKVLSRLYFGNNIENKDIIKYINDIDISKIQYIISILSNRQQLI